MSFRLYASAVALQQHAFSGPREEMSLFVRTARSTAGDTFSAGCVGHQKPKEALRKYARKGAESSQHLASRPPLPQEIPDTVAAAQQGTTSFLHGSIWGKNHYCLIVRHWTDSTSGAALNLI